MAVQLLMIFVATHAFGCSERGELNCDDTYRVRAGIMGQGYCGSHSLK